MGRPQHILPACGVQSDCFWAESRRGQRRWTGRSWRVLGLGLLLCHADAVSLAQERAAPGAEQSRAGGGLPNVSPPSSERGAEPGGGASSAPATSAPATSAPTTSAPATSAPGLELPADTPLNFFPVYFSPGDIELRVDGQTILQYSAAALLKSGREGMLRVEGRSDGVENTPEGPTREARLALSRRRAEVVRDFLVQQGVPSTRFIVVGLGSSSPLGLLESDRDRERNRVVTLSLMAQSVASQSSRLVSLPAPVQGEVRTYASAELNQAAGYSGVSGGEVPSDGSASSQQTGAQTGGASSSGATGLLMPGEALGTSAPVGAGGVQAGGESSTSSGNAGEDSPETSGAAPVGAGSAGAPGGSDAARKSTEVIAIRERNKPRGPGAVETVQLGLRIIKREGAGATGGSRWPIQDYLQQAMPELERLFRAGLTRERALVGETRIRLKLDAEGVVTGVGVVLPYPQADFEAELSKALATWILPPPPGQAPMRLEFALTVYATFQHYLMTPR